MNQDIKREWVEALRSGDYAQTKDRLKRLGMGGGEQPGYCCLGVLAEVLIKRGIGCWRGDLHYGECDGEEERLSSEDIPSPIAATIELEMRDQQQLAEMNDSGDSFEEIADYIEKSL